MEDILELSKSPAFWFSSVVIAFIMSLFASYAKDWIEDLKIKLSVKRKALTDPLIISLVLRCV